MFARPGIAVIRCRPLSQIRLLSEPSTSNEAIQTTKRHRFSFAETVLKGHAPALEEMEDEIVKRENARIKDLQSSENLLRTCLLPHLQSKVLSNSRFVPVGSSVTGLASSHSDLDVVIFPSEKRSRDEFVKAIHPNEGLKYELMSVLRSTIVHTIHSWGDARFEVEDCHILPVLKVPLVICQFTNGTSLDISIPDASFQSIRNTHLMRQFANCDVRVGRLLLWLKMWSTALEIRESKSGLLSTYHLLLLVIHFLQSDQTLTNPVLPVLYQTHRDSFSKDIPIDKIVTALEGPPQTLNWTSKNTMSTAELVIRFLAYYGEPFNNVLKKSIYIDRGMSRSRLGPVAEQAAIFDPYSTVAACRSVNALRAFNEAVLFTRRRMCNGYMFNPFSPSSDFTYFVESTEHLDWRVAAVKKSQTIKRSELVVNEKFNRHSTS